MHFLKIFDNHWKIKSVMKNLSILGSTGSIGRQTLKIVEMFPDRFTVKVLAAGRNISLMAHQISLFNPDVAVVLDKTGADKLKELIPSGSGTNIMYGEQGYRIAATHHCVDTVVTAMVGAAGLMPTVHAVDAGKNIALANKETLVMAGEIVINKAEAKGVKILPVDSEHSAIFQCIKGNRKQDIDKIILTASGGPFIHHLADEFAGIKPKDALNHPTWEMGKKISIDSATLMNKGLEIIEARWLFDILQDRIDVLIHPESIVHSMVSFNDGSIMAQLGVPDMKTPIAYALSYPERILLKQPLPEFADVGALTFEKPDLKKFPCLALAYLACETGGTLPAVLNAANEEAVNSFLDNRLSFIAIPDVIKKTMDQHDVIANPSLDDILKADAWARNYAKKLINSA